MSHYDDFPLLVQIGLIVFVASVFSLAVVLGMIMAHYCY